ncbi:hypothetical protein Tco_0320352 [Tanacetum coccineum]
MVISSPCLTDIKNWLVQKQTAFELASPKQTALGKEALAIPEQTDTGKEISNPFMAGSLAKNYIANLVGEDCWVLEDFTTNAAVQHCAASEDLVLLIKIKENRLSL